VYKVTRKEARSFIVLPALAGALAVATRSANAADNKKQFHYQDKPRARRQEMLGVSLLQGAGRLHHRHRDH
jgi:hypothetical protein